MGPIATVNRALYVTESTPFLLEFEFARRIVMELGSLRSPC